jgi:hypothetical protein
MIGRSWYDYANAVAVQQDGKIISAGKEIQPEPLDKIREKLISWGVPERS